MNELEDDDSDDEDSAHENAELSDNENNSDQLIAVFWWSNETQQMNIQPNDILCKLVVLVYWL